MREEYCSVYSGELRGSCNNYSLQYAGPVQNSSMAGLGLINVRDNFQLYCSSKTGIVVSRSSELSA